MIRTIMRGFDALGSLCTLGLDTDVIPGKQRRILCGWVVMLAGVWWPGQAGAAFAAEPGVRTAGVERRMPGIIEQFSADRLSLTRTYSAGFSPQRMSRMEAFYRDELAALAAMNFYALGEDDKIDYLLLRNRITADLHQLAIQKKQVKEMQPLIPFAALIDQLIERKRLMQRPDGEKDAAALTAMVKQIGELRKQLDPKPHPAHAEEGESKPEPADGTAKPKVNPVVANRAYVATQQLAMELHDWFAQYNLYDPMFTWWVEQPNKDAEKALKEYEAFLKEKLIGTPSEDETTIIGDPVGREALLNQLADDMIPYTPEELIAIAQTEYDWCMREMLKATQELGFGDNWHAAVEKVKQTHVPPGEQPEVIRKLVLEGADFVKQNNLVTVPPLADETWRMIMMTPERQLVNPFFTGGNELSVSYPTDIMTYDQRENSMRGNNTPMSRATAFHEMIPGHFLQFYMSARHHTYRRVFATPFWSEGNAFWWEMLFWDKGFDQTPEDRVGALVWRMHRSARVIFTMNFHLGKWTPQECVQSLVDTVGFEPENATAEVRRSFDGSVGPLYQSAYLMGALQFRALHQELVDSNKMTDREFHDAILQEGAMPIEMLRAELAQRKPKEKDKDREKLSPDFKPSWKFYGEHPTHP